MTRDVQMLYMSISTEVKANTVTSKELFEQRKNIQPAGKQQSQLQKDFTKCFRHNYSIVAE